jgi:hypothetical protein
VHFVGVIIVCTIKDVKERGLLQAENVMGQSGTGAYLEDRWQKPNRKI